MNRWSRTSFLFSTTEVFWGYEVLLQKQIVCNYSTSQQNPRPSQYPTLNSMTIENQGPEISNWSRSWTNGGKQKLPMVWVILWYKHSHIRNQGQVCGPYLPLNQKPPKIEGKRWCCCTRREYIICLQWARDRLRLRRWIAELAIIPLALELNVILLDDALLINMHLQFSSSAVRQSHRLKYVRTCRMQAR